MLNFRTLYKSQHHKSLYLRVAGIHRFDDAFLASLKASERVSFYFHKVFFQQSSSQVKNDNDSHSDTQ